MYIFLKKNHNTLLFLPNDKLSENMISKGKQKILRNISSKKYRQKTGLFLAEGHKITEELLKKLDCVMLIGTEEWFSNKQNLNVSDCETVTKDELKKISLLVTPQDIMGVFRIPENIMNYNLPETELCLALDNVQDPGNLGTIIRIADWFGIKNIICSNGTADAFNPKTVQATMGAIGRINIFYTDLKDFISHSNAPVYGTFLEGDTIYDAPLGNNGIIVMGNEGNGISDEIKQFVSKKLFIPDYPLGETTSESLNVSIATAIVCSEFRRRNRLQK